MVVGKKLYDILYDTTRAGLVAKIMAEAEHDSYFEIYGGVTWDGTNYNVLVRYSSPKSS